MNVAIESEFLNYTELEKDEIAGVISQKLFVPPKVKSHVVNSSTSVDIEWSKESLNLTHLRLLLKIAELSFPSSLTLNRFRIVISALEDPIFRPHSFHKRLPVRVKYSFDR